MLRQNVKLSARHAAFIREGIDTGQYCNASAVIRAALRLLEERVEEDRRRVDTLRRLATDAFDSIDRGEHVTIDPEQLGNFMDRMAPR